MIGPDSVTNIGASLSSVTGSDTGETIGKEQFLQLLVAQLTHQDPLNPMQGTEFTAQLAQFTSLEQLININKNMGALGDLQTAVTQTQAIEMIGKQITAEGNTISMTDGISSNVIFSLEKATDSATVSVFDQSGNLVSVINTGVLSAGQNTIAFAGFDANNEPLPDGLYTFQVSAVDAEGKDIQATTFSSGIVSGVNIGEDGTTNLQIGTTGFPLSAVVQVTEPKFADGEI
ncbi:flagellar hook assembly protein FlgD [Nitrospinota bacterium]